MKNEFPSELISPDMKNPGGKDIYMIRTGLLFLPSIRRMKTYTPAQIKIIADDISSHGFYEPLTVLRVGTGSFTPYFYQIVNGELRYRACLYAGISAAPCIILGEMLQPTTLNGETESKDNESKDAENEKSEHKEAEKPTERQNTKFSVSSPDFLLNSVVRSAEIMSKAGYKTELTSSEDDDELRISVVVYKRPT